MNSQFASVKRDRRFRALVLASVGAGVMLLAGGGASADTIGNLQSLLLQEGKTALGNVVSP